MRGNLISLLCSASLATATIYSLKTHAPGTACHDLPVNVANQGFFAGLSTPSASCPPDGELPCPPVLGSMIHEGMSGLAVMVPGGQQTYVAPAGELAYTKAHSSAIPGGSFVGMWHHQTVAAVDVLTYLAPDNSGLRGLKCCPLQGADAVAAAAGEGPAVYRLFAHVVGFVDAGCIDLVGLVESGVEADFGAWQYN